MTERTDFLTRLSSRIKHGLLTQEFLDRLARVGVNIYPYFLVHEIYEERPEVEQQTAKFQTRFLDWHDLKEVSNLPARPFSLARLESRMSRGGCFAVWEGTILAAYSWYSLERIPAAVGGYPLCPLPSGAAYLYDAYVVPEYRGRRIAPYMRHKLYQALKAEGIDDYFSITLAFNRSSRRFKVRLGAEEFETRLLLGIARVGGVDVRLSRTQPLVDTPRLMRLRRNTKNHGS